MSAALQMSIAFTVDEAPPLDEPALAPVAAVAGHFPHLRRTPASDPNYVMPPRHLPGDEEDDEPRPLINLLVPPYGPRFGHLVVKVLASVGSAGGASWHAQCDAPTGPGGAPCGKWRRDVPGSALLAEEVRSCGCYRTVRRVTTETHGEARS